MYYFQFLLLLSDATPRTLVTRLHIPAASQLFREHPSLTRLVKLSCLAAIPSRNGVTAESGVVEVVEIVEIFWRRIKSETTSHLDDGSRPATDHADHPDTSLFLFFNLS